jgi:hypothetical protein
MPDGQKYRANFVGRPDLNSLDFKDYTGRVERGLEVLQEGETWRVSDIILEEGDARETLVFERVDESSAE